MILLRYKLNRNLFTTFINPYTTINIVKRFGGNSSKTGKEIATKTSATVFPRNTHQSIPKTPRPMDKTTLKSEKHPTSEELKITYEKSVEEARKQAHEEAAQKTRKKREEEREQQNELSKELQKQKERKEQIARYTANQEKPEDEPTFNEDLLQNKIIDSPDISTSGPIDLGGNEFNEYKKVFYEKQAEEVAKNIEASIKKHYPNIMECCEKYKERLKNIFSLKDAQKEILKLYEEPCMKEAFDLLSIKRYGAPLTQEQINIIQNLIQIKNQLQAFAENYTNKYKEELQSKIEKIADIELRELCLKLLAKKEWATLQELLEVKKIYADMQHYLRNHDVSDEILNYIGLSCGILKFQKTSPILQSTYYDKLEQNSEVYSVSCLSEKPAIDFVLNSKYFFAKLPCPDNIFMELSSTTHYSFISENPYTLSNGKKVYLMPGYITSKKHTTSLLSYPNNAIVTPEGIKTAKYLFTFNSCCFITEEEMKSVSLFNGNISLKEQLEISKNIWSNNVLKKPLVMTADAFKHLLIEACLEEEKILNKSCNILSNGTEGDKMKCLRQQKLSQDNESKNKFNNAYSNEIQEAISMVNSFAKDLESTKKKNIKIK